MNKKSWRRNYVRETMEERKWHGIMRENSCTRINAEAIVEEQSWRSTRGAAVMEGHLWRRDHEQGIMEEQSSRRHLGRHLGNIWQTFGKHLERIWDPRAPGAPEASWTQEVTHLSATKNDKFIRNVDLTICF